MVAAAAETEASGRKRLLSSGAGARASYCNNRGADFRKGVCVCVSVVVCVFMCVPGGSVFCVWRCVVVCGGVWRRVEVV